MRPKKQIITLLALFFFVGISLNAYAGVSIYNLLLEATTDANGVNVATSFNQGDVVYLNILLDNPANVAGVAFTLTYDNTQVTGPASGPEGLPENVGDVVSHFPFMSAATETHRFNSSETNKIYLAGAEIDPDTGGGKWATGPITLFTIKFTAKIDAVLGTHTFVLEQTELFNLDAGYGTDIIVNGTYDEGTDTKDPVAVLVGAIPSSDLNWGGDLSDDFPDLTPDLGALPSLPITILACLDSEPDGLCDLVETNTGTYNGPNDTGTDPNDDDSDNDGIKDGDEVNTYNTDPNRADSDDDGINDKWEIDNSLDPNESNNGVDTDNDGYSDLVESQNGTDPQTQDDPYAYDNYDPATDDRGPYQEIATDPAEPRGVIGSTFDMDVFYNTSDGVDTLSGVGIRIHYQSSQLTWNSFSNVFDESGTLTVKDATAQDDTTTDYDNDPTTDKYLELRWDDGTNSWPGNTLPLLLFTTNFSVNAGLSYGDSSNIGFSFSYNDTGYTPHGTTVLFKAVLQGTVSQSYETGLNLVPFALIGSGIVMASDLDAAIVAANPGTVVTQIFSWDGTNQRYSASYVNLGGGFTMGDFELMAGMSYFVETDGPAALDLNGTDFSNCPLYAGLNVFALPPGRAIAAGIVNASDLDAEIVNNTGLAVTQIFGWDSVNQRFTGSYVNLGGGFTMGDFVLDEGIGYFIEVNGDGIYQP